MLRIHKADILRTRQLPLGKRDSRRDRPGRARECRRFRHRQRDTQGLGRGRLRPLTCDKLERGRLENIVAVDPDPDLCTAALPGGQRRQDHRMVAHAGQVLGGALIEIAVRAVRHRAGRHGLVRNPRNLSAAVRQRERHQPAERRRLERLEPQVVVVAGARLPGHHVPVIDPDVERAVGNPTHAQIEFSRRFALRPRCAVERNRDVPDRVVHPHLVDARREPRDVRVQRRRAVLRFLPVLLDRRRLQRLAAGTFLQDVRLLRPKTPLVRRMLVLDPRLRRRAPLLRLEDLPLELTPQVLRPHRTADRRQGRQHRQPDHPAHRIHLRLLVLGLWFPPILDTRRLRDCALPRPGARDESARSSL